MDSNTQRFQHSAVFQVQRLRQGEDVLVGPGHILTHCAILGRLSGKIMIPAEIRVTLQAKLAEAAWDDGLDSHLSAFQRPCDHCPGEFVP